MIDGFPLFIIRITPKPGGQRSWTLDEAYKAAIVDFRAVGLVFDKETGEAVRPDNLVQTYTETLTWLHEYYNDYIKESLSATKFYRRYERRVVTAAAAYLNGGTRENRSSQKHWAAGLPSRPELMALRLVVANGSPPGKIGGALATCNISHLAQVRDSPLHNNVNSNDSGGFSGDMKQSLDQLSGWLGKVATDVENLKQKPESAESSEDMTTLNKFIEMIKQQLAPKWTAAAKQSNENQRELAKYGDLHRKCDQVVQSNKALKKDVNSLDEKIMKLEAGLVKTTAKPANPLRPSIPSATRKGSATSQPTANLNEKSGQGAAGTKRGNEGSGGAQAKKAKTWAVVNSPSKWTGKGGKDGNHARAQDGEESWLRGMLEQMER